MSMSAGTLVSLEEYLNTAYHPDVEYVDGVLVERNTGDQSGPFMHGPVTQNSGGDELLKKAQASALMGAFSVSGLKPTITVPGGSINITDPSENMTILANGPAGCSGTACGFNVLNLQDLVLSNGTLYLTSTYTGTPDAPLPTLVVNINGRFKLSGGSKIVLQAHMMKYTRSIT